MSSSFDETQVGFPAHSMQSSSSFQNPEIASSSFTINRNSTLNLLSVTNLRALDVHELHSHVMDLAKTIFSDQWDLLVQFPNNFEKPLSTEAIQALMKCVGPHIVEMFLPMINGNDRPSSNNCLFIPFLKFLGESTPHGLTWALLLGIVFAPAYQQVLTRLGRPQQRGGRLAILPDGHLTSVLCPFEVINFIYQHYNYDERSNYFGTSFTSVGSAPLTVDCKGTADIEALFQMLDHNLAEKFRKSISSYPIVSPSPVLHTSPPISTTPTPPPVTVHNTFPPSRSTLPSTLPVSPAFNNVLSVSTSGSSIATASDVPPSRSRVVAPLPRRKSLASKTAALPPATVVAPAPLQTVIPLVTNEIAFVHYDPAETSTRKNKKRQVTSNSAPIMSNSNSSSTPPPPPRKRQRRNRTLLAPVAISGSESAPKAG